MANIFLYINPAGNLDMHALRERMIVLDHIAPNQVIRTMVDIGEKKAKLPPEQLVIRGFLAAALLGFATTLAYTFEIQTNVGLYGAIVFPVGFAMIILLGLELVTGNFALIPLAVIEKRVTVKEMLRNWFWVLFGHMLGGIFYGILMFVTLTNGGITYEHSLVSKLASVAEAKTNAYSENGWNGMMTVFVKAVLCNWLVSLGAVLALTSSSNIGKIAAMWLPIMTFFGQGFEHSVVNMFVIPAGMMLGADVTMAGWWLWNQIPSTIGNVLGGFLFTGLPLYAIHMHKQKEKIIPGKSDSRHQA